MFKITIEAESMGQLAARIAQLHAGTRVQFATDEQPKPTTTRGRKAKETAADLEPQRPDETIDEHLSAEDAEMKRELEAPAEPMPETAKAVVDAGTGQPVAPADDAPVQMTKTEIRTAAGKLAAKDTAALGDLLKKYGAGKLSEVPDDKLADFAGDVLSALDGGNSQLD